MLSSCAVSSRVQRDVLWILLFLVDFLKASPVREALVLNTKLRICLKMYLGMIEFKSVLEPQPSQGHVRHIYFLLVFFYRTLKTQSDSTVSAPMPY